MNAYEIKIEWLKKADEALRKAWVESGMRTKNLEEAADKVTREISETVDAYRKARELQKQESL